MTEQKQYLRALKLLILLEIKKTIEKKKKGIPSNILHAFDFDQCIALTQIAAFTDYLHTKNAVPNGKTFDIFKAEVETNPKMTFILTARPIMAKRAILDFLNKHGVDIKSNNVACLGSSNKSAKSRWIKNKVKELSADGVEFWDDKSSQIEAVEELRSDPEMTGVQVKTTLVV